MKVEIILKSGKSFVIECEKFKVKYSADGTVHTYEYEGLSLQSSRPVFINPASIDAVIQLP